MHPCYLKSGLHTQQRSSLTSSYTGPSRLLVLTTTRSKPDLITLASRAGEMPAYSTIYNALKGLSLHEADVTLAHATDLTKLGFLQFDNVQNYSRKRDQRIGYSNKMNVGTAGTYCELEGVDITSADLDDKQRRVLENQRAHVTVEKLLSMIDTQHM